MLCAEPAAQPSCKLQGKLGPTCHMYGGITTRIEAGCTCACACLPVRCLQVIYGMDYARDQAAARVDAVRHEVISHLSAAPDALLVIEEYDKLDCAARGLWRQLLQHPERANITSHRCADTHTAPGTPLAQLWYSS